MKKLSLLVGIVFISIFLFSVQSNSEAKEKAIVQIGKLRSGTMLVRLSDKAPVIKALEDKGMFKRAKMVAAQQEKLNKEIVASFRDFSFCTVYFFYSSDTDLLRKNKSNKINFYHSFDSIVKGVKIDTNFFVVDFGILRNEPSSSIQTEQPEETGITKKQQYKGTNVTNSIKCMYLRDNEFKQLEGPFPFYVRFYPSPIQSLSYKQVIERMDKQLNSYFFKYYK